MFTLPFITYHYSRKTFEEDYGLEPPKSYIYAVIAAVCVIQAIIFSYVYQAFKDDKIERKIAEMKKSGKKE